MYSLSRKNLEKSRKLIKFMNKSTNKVQPPLLPSVRMYSCSQKNNYVYLHAQYNVFLMDLQILSNVYRKTSSTQVEFFNYHHTELL